MLYKSNYVQSDPDEFLVINDSRIRKEVLKIYNLKRKDFKSDQDFDEYLEQIEDKIFILNDIDSTKEDKARVSKEMY